MQNHANARTWMHSVSLTCIEVVLSRILVLLYFVDLLENSKTNTKPCGCHGYSHGFPGYAHGIHGYTRGFHGYTVPSDAAQNKHSLAWAPMPMTCVIGKGHCAPKRTHNVPQTQQQRSKMLM